MVEAMWTITFQRPGGEGGNGVMVLETGRIFGGDSNFCFIGTYSVEGGTLEARVRVSRHATGMMNIFGIDDFSLVLMGQVAADRMKLAGFMEGAPQAQLQVIAVRKSELP